MPDAVRGVHERPSGRSRRSGSGSTTIAVLLPGALVVAFLVPGVYAAERGCPTRDQILARLVEVHPERGSRTTRFETAPPEALYGKAAGEIERSFVSRQGKTVQAVRVTEHSIETMWEALNDEPHHALDGYVPVRHSEVIEGTPRGTSRLLFQYFKKAGIGRWWVSRVEMNADLYRSSEGALWELYWKDVLDTVDPTRPPLDSVSSDMAPLKRSHGAWLLIPLAPSCTLVEYYNYTEPGGFVSLGQALLAKSSVRDTLDGIVRLADEHLPEPDPDAVFVRPDGSPLD